MACAYVFPRISVRGVEMMIQLDGRLLRKRMKSAMERLVVDGVIALQDSAGFSPISFRRGGNSVSAAQGVRDKVRQMHGRWGSAGMVERGLTSEAEYNSQLARDGGAILAALNQDGGRHMSDAGKGSGSGSRSGSGRGTGGMALGLEHGNEESDGEAEDVVDSVAQVSESTSSGCTVLY